MKKFIDFFKIRESEDANLQNVDPMSHSAYLAAVEAFKMILSSNEHQHKAIKFLQDAADFVPSIKSVLQRHGLDQFKNITKDTRPSHQKSNVITKGLGDFSYDDVAKNSDVVVQNMPDSQTNPID